MAKPFGLDPIPHRYYVPTRWSYPKENIGMRSEDQEIDYSDTITMQSGGGGHWAYCNQNKEVCEH